MVSNYINESYTLKHTTYTTKESPLREKFYMTFEEDTETLVIKWKGPVSSDEVKEGYMAMLGLVGKIRPKKWIIDVHKREQIQSEDQRWIFKNVFATALQLIKRDVFVAVILPVPSYHSLVSELNGDELIQDGNLFILNHFLYEEEGRRWLQEVTSFNK